MTLLFALFGLIAFMHQVSATACPSLSASADPTRTPTTSTPDTNSSPPRCPSGEFCYNDGTNDNCYVAMQCPRLPYDWWVVRTANSPVTTTDPAFCTDSEETCYNDGTVDSCYTYYTTTDRPHTQAPPKDCVRVFWPMTPASVIAEANPSTGACPQNTHCEEGRTTNGQQGRFCIGNGYVDPNRLTVPWYFV
ncbi:unnamed protein product, partial [Mesorhabditis spiculigera]